MGCPCGVQHLAQLFCSTVLSSFGQSLVFKVLALSSGIYFCKDIAKQLAALHPSKLPKLLFESLTLETEIEGLLRGQTK